MYGKTMNDNNHPKFTNEIRPLANAFKESLPQIKNLILTPIAFGYAIAEKTLQEASESRTKAKQQEENRLKKELKEKKEMKIEEEIRAEERQKEKEKRLYEEKNKLTPRKLIHTGLAVISTTALVIGVAQLVPIARWSRSVNECILELSLSNPKLTSAEKTVICNKGNNNKNY